MRAISFCMLFCALFSLLKVGYAQGTIEALIPNVGLPGQEIELVIRGRGTAFQTGSVTLQMGPDILVNNLLVSNSNTLRANIFITPGATTGPRNVTIISNSQPLLIPAGFEVLSSGNTVLQAFLEINPSQVLYAADFNPETPEMAPFLFRINIINDQTPRTVRARFSLFLENQGLIGNAEKRGISLQPNGSFAFDNREFDSYNVQPDNRELLSQIFATGVFPPGNYTYRIEILSGNTVLATSEAFNTLMNQMKDLVIISPGMSIESGLPPENQLSPQPLFQWISSANQFDLAVYKLRPGMANAQQIVQQLPIFRAFNILGNSFIYPITAAPLEEGAIYAWQLRAYVNAPTGNLFVESPLYWFVFGLDDPYKQVVREIKVQPEAATLNTNGTLQLTCKAINEDFEELEVRPQWKVIPEDFGSVNALGQFKGGPRPGFGAVAVSYGDVQDHAVIELQYFEEQEFIFNLIDLLFEETSTEKEDELPEAPPKNRNR
jgi:hypothetical protein